MTTRTRLVSALAAAAGLASAVSAQTITFVASPFDPAPGVAGGFFTNQIEESPSIDDAGNIAFKTKMVQDGTNVVASNDRGVWFGTAGNLQLVLRAGTQAPGLPAGITLNSTTGAASGLTGSVRMNSAGQIIIGSALYGPNAVPPVATTTDSALFYGTPGNMNVAVREGDPAANTGFNFTTTFTFSQQPLVTNASGALSFKATFSDVAATNDALFTGLPGALTVAARKNDAAPGCGGARFNSWTSTFFNIINASGQIATEGNLIADATTTPATTTSNDKTLWVYTPGNGMTLIARESDPAPGTVGATFNSSFNGAQTATWSPNTSPTCFNNNGFMVFTADLWNGDVVGTTNNFALYTWSSGTLTMAKRKGDPAPGTDGLLNVINTSSICVNNNNEMFCWGTISDAGGGTVTAANDLCAWAGAPNNLQLVLREGDAAPGVPGAFIGGTSSGSPVFNDNGYAVLRIALTGAVTAGVDDNALYALKAGQAPILLLRTGMILNPGPGIGAQPVTSMAWNQFSNGNGRSLNLNNQNKLACNIFFPGTTSLPSAAAIIQINSPVACYANCDGSTIAPALNVNDFNCFLNQYAAGDTNANCDHSTIAPVLNVNDFNCFLNAYAAGCP